MVAKAHAKYLRISPRKVKIVADLIRGKSLAQATGILLTTPKAASEPLLKLLKLSLIHIYPGLGRAAVRSLCPAGPGGERPGAEAGAGEHGRHDEAGALGARHLLP